MSLPPSDCVVRLTEDAVSDLYRLQRKEPRVVRAVFKKMLLLERSPLAGQPLLGALVGFRKLVVGNRHYRIVWRVTHEDSGTRVLEISEVWALGARSDAEVYEEMKARVATLRSEDRPELHSLADVIEKMGRLYEDLEAVREPVEPDTKPEWLTKALEVELHLSPDEIAELSEEEAKQRIMEYWSSKGS